MRHTKRKIFLLAIIASCIAIAAAGTLAYFNAEDTAHNVITSGKVEIKLQEWADLDRTTPFENQTGVMPGSEVTKLVEVKNTGKSPAWVRVKVSITVLAASDDLADAPAEQLPTDGVLLNFDTDNWTQGEDGFWYCNAALPVGETTAPLFTQVTFETSLDNSYQGSTATITVEAEAVQTANNGESALTAAGWPAETQQ